MKALSLVFKGALALTLVAGMTACSEDKKDKGDKGDERERMQTNSPGLKNVTREVAAVLQVVEHKRVKRTRTSFAPNKANLMSMTLAAMSGMPNQTQNDVLPKDIAEKAKAIESIIDREIEKDDCEIVLPNEDELDFGDGEISGKFPTFEFKIGGPKCSMKLLLSVTGSVENKNKIRATITFNYEIFNPEMQSSYDVVNYKTKADLVAHINKNSDTNIDMSMTMNAESGGLSQSRGDFNWTQNAAFAMNILINLPPGSTIHTIQQNENGQTPDLSEIFKITGTSNEAHVISLDGKVIYLTRNAVLAKDGQTVCTINDVTADCREVADLIAGVELPGAELPIDPTNPGTGNPIGTPDVKEQCTLEAFRLSEHTSQSLRAQYLAGKGLPPSLAATSACAKNITRSLSLPSGNVSVSFEPQKEYMIVQVSENSSYHTFQRTYLDQNLTFGQTQTYSYALTCIPVEQCE